MKYKEKFQQYLDENTEIQSGLITIGNFSYPPSEVLESLDEISFNEQYEEWYQSELDNVLELAASSYPYPIAKFAAIVLDEYDNSTHRLQALRSLWECVINFMFGVIISECAQANSKLNDIDLEGRSLCFSDCYTDKMARKIAISKSLLLSDQLDGLNFKNLFPVEICDQLNELNRQRNDLQHKMAQNEDDSGFIFGTLLNDVNKVLYDLQELSNSECLIYKRSGESPVQIIFGTLNGSSGTPKNNTIPIEDSEILTILKTDLVYFKHNEKVFSISPFYIFKERKVAYHKKKKRVYDYLSDSIANPTFEEGSNWDLIKNLF